MDQLIAYAYVSINATTSVTNRDNCIVNMQAEPGNPYNGYNLARATALVERITGQAIERAFVDRGYCGYKLKVPQMLISGSKRGLTSQMNKELKPPKRDRAGDWPHEGRWQAWSQRSFGQPGRQDPCALVRSWAYYPAYPQKTEGAVVFLYAGMLVGFFGCLDRLLWPLDCPDWLQADDGLTQAEN